MIPGSQAVLAVFTASAPPDATPTVGRVELEWIAPAECPTQLDVAATTERLMLASDASVRARAEVAANEDGALELVVVVAAAGSEASYRHVGSDCDELAEIAALFIAVAADRLAPIDAPALVPEPVAPSLPPTTPAVSASAATTPSAPRVGGWLRLHGVIGYAQLPELDAGVGFAAAIGIDRFRVELSYVHLFARERELPGLAPATGALAADDFAVRGCVELGRRRVRLGGCLGPELGAVTGRARNVSEPGQHTSLWVAATAGPVLRWLPTERFQLHLGVDGVLALHRPEFALEDDPSATISTQRGGVRATLGVAIGLGRERMRGGSDQTRRRRRS